ncbi:MAG: tail fiber domain-containing protein [Bacteroidota bacterium]
MKPKLSTFYLLSFIFCLFALCPPPPALGQVPQGFNYQAVAKANPGGVITNATLQVKISFLSDTIAQTIVYEELHSSVKTNMSGVFNIVIGDGVRQAGSAAKFSDINWAAKPLYLKTQVYYNNAWKYMGTSKLWSVPYSMVTASMPETIAKIDIRGTETSPDSAIFVVKNKNGQIVFAVYNEGVRVYVDDGVAKGPKGGFVIGGFGTSKGTSQDYMSVTSDSVRVYVDENPAKGHKGGFAIGGFGTSKESSESFLQLTPKNYFIGHKSGKAITTGLYNSFLGYMSGLKTTDGIANTFFGDSTGLNNTYGSYNVFLGKNAGMSNDSSISNVFIGKGAGELATHTAKEYSGNYNVAIGTLAGYSNKGLGNVFLGQEAGYSNTTGNRNVFLGTLAGYYNDTASFNVGIGTSAGYNNMGKSGVFIGDHAGFENLGNYNVFIGTDAGYSTTTGEKNVILGSDAGYYNTTGIYNTFIGNLTGTYNSTGNYNLYAGSEAGYTSTEGEHNVYLGNLAGTSATGSYNTIIGNAAGKDITVNYNTMVGQQAGYATTTGKGNAFFGHESGHENISGEYNTIIGPAAGYNNTTGSYNVFLGRWAGYYETGSNKLYIDNYGNNDYDALIYGDFSASQLRFNAYVGINSTPDSYYRLYVTGAAYATVGWYYPSDIRLKKNVRSLDGDGVADKVREMSVISYNYKEEVTKGEIDPGTKFIGVVAQDIEKAFPEAVRTDENGYKAVSLNALTAILLQAVKDQQKQIDELKREVEELRKER